MIVSRLEETEKGECEESECERARDFETDVDQATFRKRSSHQHLLSCLLALSFSPSSLARVRSQTNLSTSARRSELLRVSPPTPPCDDTSSRWRAPLLPEAAMMPPPVDDDDGEGRSADARPELALVLVLPPPLLPLTRMGLR
jgi:hypothetical protein